MLICALKTACSFKIGFLSSLLQRNTALQLQYNTVYNTAFYTNI